MASSLASPPLSLSLSRSICSAQQSHKLFFFCVCLVPFFSSFVSETTLTVHVCFFTLAHVAVLCNLFLCVSSRCFTFFFFCSFLSLSHSQNFVSLVFLYIFDIYVFLLPVSRQYIYVLKSKFFFFLAFAKPSAPRSLVECSTEKDKGEEDGSTPTQLGEYK